MSMTAGAGRPTRVLVNLSALAWNIRQVRRLVGPHVRILAVVKANAYGHGAVPVAHTLVAAGADHLGVATVEEGRELRRAGLRLPILIFGLVQGEDAVAALRWRLTPTVASTEQARGISRVARRGGRRLPVHVKVDTGMGRIGLPAEGMPAFARTARQLSGIRLEGVYTHFAHADGRDPKLLRAQLARLQQARAAMREAGIGPVTVHAANSAAVLDAPETHLDMVRPGLMLYGLYPAPRFRNRVRLKPVLSWTTRIVFLKDVPAGTGLSYGHTYVARRPLHVATLPVGYADGYSRALSNCGQVLVRGRRCPIVGRVCMDMALVDVTHIPGVRLGDEVVLIGRQGREAVTADDVANRLGTISYEVVCAIGQRVPRIAEGGRA